MEESDGESRNKVLSAVSIKVGDCDAYFCNFFIARLGRKCCLACFLIFTIIGCSNPSREIVPSETDSKSVEFNGRRKSFDVFWPPAIAASSPKTRPILKGDLCAAQKQGDLVQVHIELTRPAKEEDRKRWNRVLAFPEYSWMSKVRVWDMDKKWLWPNVQCLLTAHGRKRAERYGGIDPGKGVDNDYAAILIRQLDSDGRPIQADQEMPLVSAEWYSFDKSLTGRIHAISHQAKSDVLNVKIPKSNAIGVWLVYADFLDAQPPKTWPKEKEFAGGILAYFELRWTSREEKREVEIKQMIPNSSTGFDWRTWSTSKSPFLKKLE